MDTKQRQHVAGTIRAARLRHGWGVGEAAERIGVTHPAWSRWESAATAPKPATLLALGELFDLPDGWWEMPATATPSHPSPTVDPDELLETIRRELAEHERRIEQMLARMTGADTDDDQRTRQQVDSDRRQQ